MMNSTYLADTECSNSEVSKLFHMNWTDTDFTVLLRFRLGPILLTLVLNIPTRKKIVTCFKYDS